MAMNLKLALSIAEASAACGIGRTTMYAAIKSGQLHVCKIGRRTLLTEEALREWLARSQRAKTHGADQGCSARKAGGQNV